MMINKPGLAVRRYEDWTTIYSTAPRLPVEFYRNVAREAGLHIYSRTNDVVYITNDLFGFHTVQPGVRTFYLPEPKNVYDLFNGRLVAENSTEFVVNVEKPDTFLYYFTDKDFTP